MQKIERNSPGWCGSGKKYKKCHMDTDQAKERSDPAIPRAREYWEMERSILEPPPSRRRG